MAAFSQQKQSRNEIGSSADADWDRCGQRLKSARIPMRWTDAPVWLVLGRPHNGLGPVLAGTSAHWNVPPLAPREVADAPFWIAAQPDRILLVCENVGCYAVTHPWVTLVSRLEQAQPQTWVIPGGSDANMSSSERTDPVPSAKTQDGPSADFWIGPELMPAAGAENAEPEPDPSLEQSWDCFRMSAQTDLGTPQRETPTPFAAPPVAVAVPDGGMTREIPEEPPDGNRARSGLKRLCLRLAEARRPYCPVNGILVFLPWDGIRTDEHAQRLTDALGEDLDVIRDLLGVQCPVMTLLADCQHDAGFRTILRATAPDRKNREFGVAFPFLWLDDAVADPRNPDRNPQSHSNSQSRSSLHPRRVARHVPNADSDADTARARGIRNGVAWLQREVIGALVVRSWKAPELHERNDASVRDMEERIRINNQALWRFRSQLWSGAPRVARLLASATSGMRGASRRRSKHPIEPMWLIGFGLAATGTAAHGEVAFVEGAMERLLSQQNRVAWTQAVTRREQRRQSAVRALRILSRCLIVALAMLVAFAVGTAWGPVFWSGIAQFFEGLASDYS